MLLRDRAAPEVPPEQRAGGKSWTYGSADGPGHLAQDISTWRLPALRAGPLMRSRHYLRLVHCSRRTTRDLGPDQSR